MAARKLQQEVEKVFKKVTEGVAEFDAIYEKLEQSTNPTQKDKLEDNLKREIKKLQRLRDQIKTWITSNDIKDKAPLVENRKIIETRMENFKAVEKAMKTKAYSKEGLSAATKLDPKEQAKAEASEFLAGMVDKLEQQIESIETEVEVLNATKKKGKAQQQQDRIQKFEKKIERHKWHQQKMEVMRRSLENGRLEAEQVRDIEDAIRYYVEENHNDNFAEDDEMYDELGLDEEEDAYAMPQEKDGVSSQDGQSTQDDAADANETKGKARAAASDSSLTRRTSAQLKSPLPTLATLQPPLPPVPSTATAIPASAMRPAHPPARPSEGLKYSLAAATAAASDRIGISPLPPPPGLNPLPSAASSVTGAGISPLPPAAASSARSVAADSPVSVPAQPVPAHERVATPPLSSLTVSKSGVAGPSSLSRQQQQLSQPPSQQPPLQPPQHSQDQASKVKGKELASSRSESPQKAVTAIGVSSDASQATGVSAPPNRPLANGDVGEEQCIYHLPETLREVFGVYEQTVQNPQSPFSSRSFEMLAQSRETAHQIVDMEPRQAYKPDMPFVGAHSYPTERLAIFDDPSLYARIDPDTLFYIFYYRQGTYQQYLAAKALKDQSWRFHKQYQTWFQRHEEPKAITEEYEQGTYRFFDYESTWMNRRKADFKFHYKHLEDEV